MIFKKALNPFQNEQVVCGLARFDGFGDGHPPQLHAVLRRQVQSCRSSLHTPWSSDDLLVGVSFLRELFVRAPKPHGVVALEIRHSGILLSNAGMPRSASSRPQMDDHGHNP